MAAGKYVPPNFNKSTVLAGLHKAMEFGAATRTDDRAAFFIRSTPVVTDAKDGAGVPFDPTVQPASTVTKVQVDCTVEYVDASEVAETFGDVRSSRIKITLLDPEYQLVKGFAYVVAGGDKYVYDSTEPPIALGSIDVWTVHATAEGER